MGGSRYIFTFRSCPTLTVQGASEGPHASLHGRTALGLRKPVPTTLQQRHGERLCGCIACFYLCFQCHTDLQSVSKGQSTYWPLGDKPSAERNVFSQDGWDLKDKWLWGTHPWGEEKKESRDIFAAGRRSLLHDVTPYINAPDEPVLPRTTDPRGSILVRAVAPGARTYCSC